MVTVSSGERVVCSECGKVIRSDLLTRQVPTEKAPEYVVREIKEVCSACQAKKEKVEEQVKIRSLVGDWTCRSAMSDVIVHFYSDRTGKWDYPRVKITWKPTTDGFTARAEFDETNYGGAILHRRISFSGKLARGGQRLIVYGWGPFGFRSHHTTIFDRIE
jgi:hypothetical protein